MADQCTVIVWGRLSKVSSCPAVSLPHCVDSFGMSLLICLALVFFFLFFFFLHLHFLQSYFPFLCQCYYYKFSHRFLRLLCFHVYVFFFSDYVSVIGALGALWLVWGHCGPLQWLFPYLGWGLTSTHRSAQGPLSTIIATQLWTGWTISSIRDYYVYKYLCCLGMRKEWTHSLNFWCLNPAVVSLKICQVTEVLALV